MVQKFIFALFVLIGCSSPSLAGDELPAWLRDAAARKPETYDKKVPAVVLLALPASTTIQGFAIPGNMTVSGVSASATFTATGLDLGLVSSYASTTNSVTYQ